MKTKEGIELRKAAKSIFSGKSRLCCDAISNIKAKYLFQAIYRTEAHLAGNLGEWFGSSLCKENQERRIIALLLAAEIADSGGL